MKAFFKNVIPYVLAILGAIATFLIGKKVSESVAKTQEKLPMRVNIPANVREISNARTLNQVVAEFTE